MREECVARMLGTNLVKEGFTQTVRVQFEEVAQDAGYQEREEGARDGTAEGGGRVHR